MDKAAAPIVLAHLTPVHLLDAVARSSALTANHFCRPWVFRFGPRRCSDLLGSKPCAMERHGKATWHRRRPRGTAEFKELKELIDG